MKMFSFLSVLLLLSMLAVPFQATADDFERGDVDLDGNVSIKDVTCLIDYLLTDEWPDPNTAGDTVLYIVNNVPFKMIKVEGGSFRMGATSEQGYTDPQSNEEPTHSVVLSSYYIGQTEVTQELWLEVMGTRPSKFRGENYPVEQVSWDECQTFVQLLSEITGKQFRLPTEAEWEFAARGGTKSQGYKYSGSNTINDVAWYLSTAGSSTHPVATKMPNELGLYDMSGNVYEWVADIYGSYSSTGQVNPTGPTSGSHRVYRGGNWHTAATKCRVSSRFSEYPSSRGDGYGTSAYNYGALGLRIAMDVEE